MMNFFLRRYGYWVLAIMVLAAAIALSGCNPHQLKGLNPQQSQLVVSTLGSPKTFNYALNQESPNVFFFTGYSGLVDQHGTTGELVPELAESWAVSEDKKKIVYTLREGLKWSDGEALTADDVVFTYNEVYLNEKIPTDIRDGLRIGEKRTLPTVKKLDDRRIQFTTTEPFSPLLGLLSSVILPAHILRDAVNQLDKEGKPVFLSTWGTDTDPKKIVVHGPYTIDSYTPSQRVIFRKNPYYWRKDKQGNSLPYIDRIVWQLVDNTDTQLLKFRSGEMDMLGLAPSEYSLLKREERRGNFTIYRGGPRSGTNFISFNLNRAKNAQSQPIVDPIKSKWFNNKSFRQAVAHAIDRPKMINNLFRGIGQLQNSPISVQSPFYLPSEKGLKVYEYNPEQARQLLLAAGFKYDVQNRLLDAEGNPVRFTLITNAENNLRVTMAAQIKQDLQAIGMQVDLNPISFNLLVEKITTSRDWECYLLGFTGDVEPHSGANIWTSKGGLHAFNQGSVAGQPPIQGWTVSEWEKEIDQLFLQGAREFDIPKRKQIYNRFQQIVQEELPMIHLIVPESFSAIRNRIQNVKFSGLDTRGSLWNVYELKAVD